MKKEDIKLVIKAFFAVNKRLRASYNSDQVLKYVRTDKYYEDILEVYFGLVVKEKAKAYDKALELARVDACVAMIEKLNELKLL